MSASRDRPSSSRGAGHVGLHLPQLRADALQVTELVSAAAQQAAAGWRHHALGVGQRGENAGDDRAGAFLPPHPPTSARTRAMNASAPVAASRAGSAPHREVTACIAVSRVSDSSGLALTAEVISTIDTSPNRLSAIYAITVDGKDQLISIDRSSAIRTWDPFAQSAIAEIHADEIQATCLANVGGQNLLVAATRDALQIWDPAALKHTDVPAGNQTSIAVMTSLPMQSRPLLVTGEFPGDIRIWDLATGTPGVAFLGHQGRVQALCPVVLNGRTLLASAGTDRTVRIWDILTHTCVKEIPVHHEALSLAWLGDEDLAIGLTAGVVLVQLDAALIPAT